MKAEGDARATSGDDTVSRGAGATGGDGAGAAWNDTPVPPATPAAGDADTAAGRRARALSPPGVAALALGLLLLLGMVGGTVWLALGNAEGVGAVERTRMVRRLVLDVSRLVQNAEASQRGYLLTGEDAYLEPYEAAARELPARFSALAQALPGEEGEARLLGPLGASMDAKMAELRATIALHRRGETEAALAVVRTDAGKAYMDEIRRLTAAMAAEQEDKLLREFGAVERRGRWLVAAAACGVLTVLALGVLVASEVARALRALRVGTARLSDANAGLASENDALEAAVRRRTAELEEASRESQRFAYIVSHDLRAPLVNIVGFTGELEAAADRLRGYVAARGAEAPAEVWAAADEDLPEAIGFVKTSAAKMDRLIGAILKLSREGRRNLVAEPLDMRALLGNVLASLRQQARAAGAEMSVGEVPDLVADRVAVEQIFGNLVENALKYRDPARPPRVRVHGWTEGEWAIFEVEDNGRGIAERDRERVFEPFRRAGPPDVPGEGIGLAHVRALVRRMGGTITFTSALREGTTFRVRLPRRMQHAMDAA